MPFVPATSGPLLVAGASLGLAHPSPRRRYVMPVIGGFVGGDTVAGILATGLAELPGPTLLVDIGTNGEIVLAAEGKLAAASTAAGPAFEGARISSGMRGSTGRSRRSSSTAVLRINVIGNVPPVGPVRLGPDRRGGRAAAPRLLTPQGRLLTADDPPPSLPDRPAAAIGRSRRPAGVPAGRGERRRPTGRPIVLTQRDLRELQLATGAIRAGIEILLRRGGWRRPTSTRC